MARHDDLLRQPYQRIVGMEDLPGAFPNRFEGACRQPILGREPIKVQRGHVVM